MKRVRMSLGGVAAGLAIAVFATSAMAASISVTSAIKAQDKKVGSSAALTKLRDFHGTTPGSVKKVIPAVKTLATKFDAAATAVAKASASTSAQKAGQRDWVSGVRTEATGLRQLDVGFSDIARKDKAAAKTALTKAEKTLKSGGMMTAKGDRLLGLPTRD